MTGVTGFSSGYYAMESCDALLMLGTDFPYRQFSPQTARIAQIDLRAEAIGRRAPVEIGVSGDVSVTLRALLPRLKDKSFGGHLDAALKHHREARKGLDDLAAGRPGGVLHPQHLARAISELAAGDAIFTCAVGLPTVWAAAARPKIIYRCEADHALHRESAVLLREHRCSGASRSGYGPVRRCKSRFVGFIDNRLISAMLE